MVTINDIPDFPGRPGQTPGPGDPSGVSAVSVVLVSTPMDPDGKWTPLNASVVNSYISAEVSAGRAYQGSVQKWSPWSDLALPIDFDDAVQYNYARITIGGKNFYGFVSAEYLNLTVTSFSIEPDDCATYSYGIGYSMWKFGHVAVAASQNDTYGINYCDAPEPIALESDFGELMASLSSSDLDTMKAIVVSANNLTLPYFRSTSHQMLLKGGAHPFEEFAPPEFPDNIILNHLGHTPALEPDPNIRWRDTSGNFYIPTVTGASGNSIDGVPQAGDVYTFTMKGLKRFLAIAQHAPWVVEGISKIMLVPGWAVSGAGDSTSDNGVQAITDPTSDLWAEARGIALNGSGDVEINTSSQTVLSGWRDTVLSNYGASAYKKLITSAGGCTITLTDGETSVDMKPENWLSGSISMKQVPNSSYGGIRVIPVGYGGMIGGELGLTLEFGGSVDPSRSGQGLAHKDNQASNQSQPFQVRRSVELGIFSALLAESTGVEVANFQAQMQAINGGLGGLAGGPVGGALGLVGGGLNAASTLTLAGMTTGAAKDNALAQLRQSLRQMLPAYAWNIDDGYAVSGQGGGTIVDGAWRMKEGRGARVIIKVPSRGRIKTLISQWKRRGYAIDRAFEPPRLDPMSDFSYWEGESVVVTGRLPSDAKRRIAKRFEQGTTVVTSISNIGKSSSNSPRSGISY